MTKSIEQTEGIVLSSIRYGDKDQIVSFFSEKGEILKFFVRHYKAKGVQFFSPLSKAEVIYYQSEKELLKTKSTSIQSDHLHLRKDWHLLESACLLLKAIELSQAPGKTSPLLYSLLLAFLQKLTKENSASLLCAFYLKTLLHEGLLSIPLSCSCCSEPLLGSDSCFPHVCQNEGNDSIVWSSQELETVYTLSSLKFLKELCSIEVSEELKKKVILYFEKMIKGIS